MPRTVLVLLLLWPLWPGPARAQPASDLDATYAVYAAGFDTASAQARLALSPAGYRVQFDFRIIGFFSAFISGDMNTAVVGTWAGVTAVPRHLEAAGVWRGDQRHTIIDYQEGQPLIRTLLPPPERERDLVPAALQRNTIDTLSALAAMVRQVAATDRCDAQGRLFDGRRLMEITVSTGGREDLPRSDRSPYYGPTLRCDFSGKLLAGFMHDESIAQQARVRHGSAWFAQVAPNVVPIPIRLTFETRWFSPATAYLAGFGQVAPAASSDAAR
ncbi:MAG: DUF3108 domain-containing protein [Acidisphaera sp.]|nr:DUF3108 domain-containing protein [Acidisphaera sp.]